MNNYLLLLPVLLPLAAGIFTFFLDSASPKTRNGFIAAALLSTVAATLAACREAGGALHLWSMTERIEIFYRADKLAVLFAVLSAAIWCAVGIYGFVYMKHEGSECRFYGFLLLSLSMMLSLSFSGNIITAYTSFELLTLLSMPLVLHSLEKEAVSAALKYLFYSVAGGFLGLCGIFFIASSCASLEFIPGGTLNAEGGMLLRFMVLLAVIGFGTKAGMYPMHGWLPTAHPVAPAPASALLSGIIAKAGVLMVIRLVFYMVGSDFLLGSWVQYAWMILALITVIMGSSMAYSENLLKKRLAYSTVSQVSYIMLGLSTLNITAFIGSLLHVVFHAVIKNTLFMSAGSIILQTGKTKVDELDDIGRSMPATMIAYTLASLALVGIPPASGFISKWYIATGAAEAKLGAASFIIPAALLLSALLTAGYLLPITIKGFFSTKKHDAAEKPENRDPAPSMLVPLLVLGCGSLLLGIFASPLLGYISGIAEDVFALSLH